MDIIKTSDITSYKQDSPSVLCLGSFDGVHIGHMALLQAAQNTRDILRTRYSDIIFGVWTFSSSPYKLAATITSFEEKAKIFEELGVYSFGNKLHFGLEKRFKCLTIFEKIIVLRRN